MRPPEKRGLGRGLSALMAEVQAESPPTSATEPRKSELSLPIEKVQPNPDQPRRDFKQDDLDSLAASIREKGIIQPLIVRKMAEDQYQIVAGERRWRAAQMAQLHEVPVIVRDFNDTEVLEIAIIENIQRADLNPIEEGLGYKQLMDRFGHTQEKLAQALSKSRSHIANLMRLLQLPEDVQNMLKAGKLSAGHARALITAPNASELAVQVVAKGLSVRETEKLANAVNQPKSRPAPRQEKDPDTKAIEGDLSASLKMKVSIDHKPGDDGGHLTIRYNSLDDLDELCRILSLTH